VSTQETAAAAADGGGGVGEADGDRVADGQLEPTAEPQTQPPNGVCIHRELFQESIDDFVAYNFFVQHCLSREATDDYLHQRRSSGACRTPHALNSMGQSSVNLETTKVDCCKSGCEAITASRQAYTSCDVCNTPWYRADATPQKQETYRPLLPWLKMMLADPSMGPGMVQAMKDAREAAGTSPVDGLGDWFHGATFRKLVELGCFSSNTFISLSLPTAGCRAWRQRGLQGLPIIATVLNVDAST